MSDEQEADKFVFTNETIMGRGCRKGKHVAIGMIVSGAIVITLPVPLAILGPSVPPGERVMMVVVSLFIGSLAVSSGILLRRGAVVRTWTLNSEGIEVHDARGQSKRLLWHQVERVRWDGREVRFRSNREQLFLPWRVIPKGQEGSLKRKIVGCLPGFNLPVVGERRFRSFLINLTLVFLHIFIILGVGSFMVIELIPMARRLKWDAMISEDMFKFIWMLLTAAMLTPIRILIEPIYWYDRQFAGFSRIGRPDP